MKDEHLDIEEEKTPVKKEEEADSKENVKPGEGVLWPIFLLIFVTC